MKTCPYCGVENDGAVAHCVNCGAALYGPVAASPTQFPSAVENVQSPPLPAWPGFQRTDWFSFALTTAATLVVYLFTLPPEITIEPGAMAAGAMYGGVAPPPGLPVWTLYSWLFANLLHVSNVAWRLAVSSAVAAALAAGLVALMVSRFGAITLEWTVNFRRLEPKQEERLRLVSAAIAGMGFGFAGIVWAVAVEIDYRALQVLLLGTGLCLLMRWYYEPARRRYLYAAFLIFGLELGTCEVPLELAETVVLGLPLFIVFGDKRLGRDLLFAAAYLTGLVLTANNLGWFGGLFEFGPDIRHLCLWYGALMSATCVVLTIWTRSILSEWRSVLTVLLLLFIGPASYFWLPLVSMTVPPVNWGYAREVGGFIHLVTRGQFERLHPTEHWSTLAQQLWLYISIAWNEFGPVYLLVALVPFCTLHRMRGHDRKVLFGLIPLYLLTSVCMLLMANPPTERNLRELIKLYFVSSYFFLALWSGYGLLILGTILARPRADLKAVAALKPVAAPLTPASS